MRPDLSNMSEKQLRTELRKLEKDAKQLGNILPTLKGVEQEMTRKDLDRDIEYIKEINNLLDEIEKNKPEPTAIEKYLPTFSKLVKHKDNSKPNTTENPSKENTKEEKTEDNTKKEETQEKKDKSVIDEDFLAEPSEIIDMFDVDKQKEKAEAQKQAEEAQKRVEEEMRQRIEEENKRKALEEERKAREEAELKQYEEAARQKESELKAEEIKRLKEENEKLKKEHDKLIKNLDNSHILSKDTMQDINELKNSTTVTRKKSSVVSLDLNDINMYDDGIVSLQHLKETTQAAHNKVNKKKEARVIELFADDSEDDNDEEYSAIKSHKNEVKEETASNIEKLPEENSEQEEDAINLFDVDEEDDSESEENSITDVLAETKESIIYDPIIPLTEEKVQDMSKEDINRDIERYSRVKDVINEKLAEKNLSKDLISNLTKKLEIVDINIKLLKSVAA